MTTDAPFNLLHTCDDGVQVHHQRRLQSGQRCAHRSTLYPPWRAWLGRRRRPGGLRLLWQLRQQGLPPQVRAGRRAPGGDGHGKASSSPSPPPPKGLHPLTFRQLALGRRRGLTIGPPLPKIPVAPLRRERVWLCRRQLLVPGHHCRPSRHRERVYRHRSSQLQLGGILHRPVSFLGKKKTRLDPKKKKKRLLTCSVKQFHPSSGALTIATSYRIIGASFWGVTADLIGRSKSVFKPDVFVPWGQSIILRPSKAYMITQPPPPLIGPLRRPFSPLPFSLFSSCLPSRHVVFSLTEGWTEPAFNATILIGGIFACAVAGSQNFVAFSAIWAVIGTAAGGNVPVDSIIFLEFIPQSRQWLLTSLSAWWNLGQLVVSLVAWVFLANYACASSEAPCAPRDNMGW